MCGIVGFASRDSLDVDSVRRGMESALGALHHRGPDDNGIRLDSHLALGHTRLSIVDLSDSGHQPMSSSDKRVWIVFNGEIYNHADLRNELQMRGYQFSSSSDTEVLVHGYQEWGLDGLLHRINGMFAFALHDINLNKLILVRDHFGIKPLYYRLSDNQLLFASEPKAMLAFYGKKPHLDEAGLALSLQHIGVPDPYSVYQEYRQVLPGCVLTFNFNDASLVENRYWRWTPRAEIYDQEEAEKYLWDAICGSVESQLRADVPVGIFLSGGIDSSLLSAACAETGYKPECFTIALPDSSQDESVYAKAVCKHYGLPHTIEMMSADDAKPYDSRLAAIYDEPFASSAALSACHISQLAAKHFKVILSGEGGDELFGGYRWYSKWLSRYGHDGMGASLSRRIYNNIRSAVGKKTDIINEYALMLGSFSQKDMRSIFNDTFLRRTGDMMRGGSIYYSYDDASLKGFDRLQNLDINLFLPTVCLRKMDRASMQHSLEVRVPFLDMSVAQVAAKLSIDVRNPHGELKGILRSIARRKLPADVANKKKKGFSTPIGKWYDRVEIIKEIEHESKTFSEWKIIFNPLLVKNIEHYSGRSLWRIWHTWRWVKDSGY